MTHLRVGRSVLTITVSLVSETWEKAEGNRKFQEETERLFELNGLKFCHVPGHQHTEEEELLLLWTLESFLVKS